MVLRMRIYFVIEIFNKCYYDNKIAIWKLLHETDDT